MDGARRLSAGQEAMWFMYRTAPGSAAYNITLAFGVHTPLDVAVLRRAADALADRHDVLRSVFAEAEDGPCRIPRPPGPVPMEVRDVPAASDAELRAMARDAGAEPFRLETEAPFRIVLLRRAPGYAVLVVVAHHIVSDRTSQWLLMRDLLDAYRGLLADGVPAWAPLTASFDDHVEAERRLLAGPRRAELERRWTELCAGVPAATLPADRPRPAAQAFTGATHRVPFPDALDRKVRDAARAAGVTPFVFLLGTFEALLHRYGGGPEFLIGCPASTRFGRGMRDVVGYLVNSLVLRARFAPGTTFADATASAQRQVRDAMDLTRFPFPLAVRSLGLPREADRPPVFQVAFTMVATSRLEPLLDLLADDASGEIEYGGLRLSVLDLEHMEGQLDLSVELRQSDTSLTAVLRYDTGLFADRTIERFGSQFLRFAEAAADDPYGRVAALSMVDAEDLQELLRMGNGATA